MYKFIDLDFETRSFADVTKVGAHKYAKHPTTEILIIGFTVDEKDVGSYSPWVDGEERLTYFKNLVIYYLRKGYLIRAFNSMFEYCIWNFVGVSQLGLPEISIEKFYCVQAEACAMALPMKLENCAKVLGLAEQKDDAGKDFINFFCKPAKKGGQLYFRSIEENMERFLRGVNYCEQDVRTQIAISRECKKLSSAQHELFILTEKMNLRGLPIDRKMIEGAREISRQIKAINDAQIRQATDGAVSSATQTKLLTEWLAAEGYHVPTLRKEFLTQIQTDDARLQAIIDTRLNGTKSSIAKFAKASLYLVGNKVHDFIKYHVAQTGRWGGKGIQIHNFAKPNFKIMPKWYNHNLLCEMIGNAEIDGIAVIYRNISEALKTGLRGMVKAPYGKKFVGADYAQIEARIVMWLAGDPQGLADFSGEGKIYEKMAGEIFGVPPETILKGSLERDVGKETVLGCGFGMGGDKFYGTCTAERGLKIELELAHRCVKGYRARYPEVKKAWKSCELAAIAAVKNPGVFYSACDGRLNYRKEGDHLFCYLPSGRPICYPFAFLDTEFNQYGKEVYKLFYYTWVQAQAGNKWVVETTWGGTEFQNAVQGIAADVMGHGLLVAEKNNYPTNFTIHDEGISLVPDKPEFNYHEYEKHLCNLPSWAKGMPIIAEGFEAKRYRKF